MHGGVTQGAGQIFGEHAVYDRDSGQLLAGSFSDYCMPRAGLIRKFIVGEHPVPSKSTCSAQGRRRIRCTASLPTLANATMDALRPLGIEDLDMPFTPSKVWHAIQAVKGEVTCFAIDYVKAKSLSDATALIGAHPEAKVLSGGMTLIPTLKQRLARPSHLVDVGGLRELSGIELKDGRLAIGAATNIMKSRASAVVKKAIPALAYLASHIGDPQVRNRGTLGGSVANNDPAADYPAAVLALDATIVTTKREIAADDFFQGMFATALEEGEIIVRVLFDVPQRAAYEKFPHPASGYAMTGVFIAETKTGIRVAVTGAGPGVFRWSEAEGALAKKLSPAALDELNSRSRRYERRYARDARIPRQPGQGDGANARCENASQPCRCRYPIPES